MKIVIGLIGQMGAGKQTVVEELQKHLAPRNVAHFSTSAILGKALDLFHLEKTRENYQRMPQAIEEYFGIGTLARSMEIDIQNSPLSVVVYDSIRWQADLDLVRKFPLHFIVSVTADQELRWKRIRDRKAKKDEGFMTLDEFRLLSQAPTEIEIPRLAEHATMTLTNDLSLEEFAVKVKVLIAEPVLRMF